MTIITYVIMSVCAAVTGTTAIVQDISRTPHRESMIIAPPTDWKAGDTVQISTTVETRGDTTIITQDTTIIRWEEQR